MNVLAPLQRRRVGVLAASQLVGGVGIGAGLAVGALLALELTGQQGMSGLPQTSNVLGAALLAFPLARLAARAGRRTALSLGFVLATVGALLAILSTITGWFVLLLIGAALAGGGSAAGFQARFAATDGVNPSAHGRVLSIVVWMTTVGAILGPNLLEPSARVASSMGLPELSGPWVVAAVFLVVAATVVRVGLSHTTPVRSSASPAPIRTVLRSIVRHPRGLVGIAVITSGHVTMVGIMAMTSVHLKLHGSSLTVIGLVISVHVAGMFALSPLFGYLSDNVGEMWVIVGGLIMLFLGALGAARGGALDSVGDHDAAEWWITVGLLLIGLGWSAGLIAGSSLVSRSSRNQDSNVTATDIQGASDLMMGLGGGLAGGLSGVVLHAVGYSGLSLVGAIVILPTVWLLVAKRRDILHTHAADVAHGS